MISLSPTELANAIKRGDILSIAPPATIGEILSYEAAKIRRKPGHSIAPKSLASAGLKVLNGRLVKRSKPDDLLIVVPVHQPLTTTLRNYADDRARRQADYFARKASGLCQKCDEPGAVMKNGKRSILCEGHLKASREYQAVVRREGTEAQRVVEGVAKARGERGSGQ